MEGINELLGRYIVNLEKVLLGNGSFMILKRAYAVYTVFERLAIVIQKRNTNSKSSSVKPHNLSLRMERRLLVYSPMSSNYVGRSSVSYVSIRRV